MRRSFLAVVIFLFVFIPAAFAAPSGEPRAQTFVLDNGLTVLVNEMPSTPVAAIYAWVKTGSANEGKFLGSGITHFVEHMLFKGTARRGPGVIPDEARSLGGSINASTSYDFTVYTLTLPKENFSQGLDLIADMVQNAVFDPQEVEREREVILKEMRMLRDRPEYRLEELVSAAVYKVHPYRFPIIGLEAFFKWISQENLKEYYDTYYAPNNMILSVAGQLKAEDVLPQIKAKFEHVLPHSAPLRNLPAEPTQISPRFVEDEYPTDLVRMTMAYQGIPLLDSDLYALDVLAMALGSGESSRFYKTIYKEKKLVQSIDAEDDTPMDRGTFEVNCLMTEDRSNDVLREVRSIMAQVQKDGLLPEELDKIKRQVMVENVYARQTAGGMASRAAMEEAFAGDPNFSAQYLDGVRAVTNADVIRVAKKYLIEPRLTVVVLKPKKDKAAVVTQGVSEAVDIDKTVLPNGLTILMKKDPSLPIIAISAAMNAGTRQEPETLGGLSALTGRVWEKGVRGKDAATISREVERRGGGVSTYSGKNTLVLEMNFLSDDLAFALDYLENFLKTPTFSDKEIADQRDQMLTAIRSRRDSISQTASKELAETLFLTHPFRRDGLGTEESLAKITRQDVAGYFNRFLSPDNMVVSVFGDMDPVPVKAELIRRLGGLPKKAVALTENHEDPPAATREKSLEMDKEQAMVMFGFQAPTIKAPDRDTLEVAVNILSSPLGGRMFKRIRDELGKAYTLGGGYTPGIDAGMVSFYVLTTNQNIDKVKAIVQEELDKIRRDGITDKELADAKAYLKAASARSLEALPSLAITTTLDELLGLGYDHYRSYNNRIDAVGKDAVQAAAVKYLDMNHAAIVVVKSSKVMP